MSELEKKFNKYRKKIFSKSGIGELYERQIRYLYEKNGWRVIPYGIIKGKSDLGRDLICIKKKQVLIIQAKNWSKSKTIHEKHLMQLSGTMLHYANKTKKIPKGIFITTTKLSNTAKDFAKELNIQYRYVKLDKNFPMIKCNVNKRGKKLYFLPFDKFYDKVHIEKNKNEFYTSSIRIAESKGFIHVGKK